MKVTNKNGKRVVALEKHERTKLDQVKALCDGIADIALDPLGKAAHDTSDKIADMLVALEDNATTPPNGA